MKYFLSAYRAPGHENGYEFADRIEFPSLTDALQWVAENAFAPKSPRVGLTMQIGMAPASYEAGVFEAHYEIPELALGLESLFDAAEVDRRKLDFQRKKAHFDAHFDQINGIEAILIEREDRARGALMEEYHEGNTVTPLGVKNKRA